eukprot:4080348-Prymnesium_polylepis.2
MASRRSAPFSSPPLCACVNGLRGRQDAAHEHGTRARRANDASVCVTGRRNVARGGGTRRGRATDTAEPRAV